MGEGLPVSLKCGLLRGYLKINALLSGSLETEDLAVGRSSRRQSSFLLGGIAAASADGVFLTGFSIGVNVKEENM